MGCDITILIEVELKDTTGKFRWEHLGQSNSSRDYELFGKLCGVRGDATGALAPCRGLPPDVNTLTKLYLNTKYHSHSYINGNELNKLKRWVDKTKSWGGNEIFEYLSWLEDYPLSKKIVYSKNFRLVFAFDS